MNQLLKLAIARFAVKHGRKLWKSELRKCWMRSSYPGMTRDDSSYLQMARNAGTDLDNLTFGELLAALVDEYATMHLRAVAPVSVESLKQWLVEQCAGVTNDNVDSLVKVYCQMPHVELVDDTVDLK